MTRMAQMDVQSISHEAVRCLQALLRIDTTNPPGNETQAAEYIAEMLSREGYEPRIVESALGRGNVVARYRGRGELAPLLIYGHLDVVTAEPEHWARGPFSGEVADGCVWGRGAFDMKGMVAQELMLMLLLQRRSVRLRRDVIFAATADEEAGGRAGLGFMVDSYPDLIAAEYGLSEGGGTTTYLAGKPFYDVRTAEKGTCRFKLHAYGRPGHGSVPRSESAITTLAEAVLKLGSTSLPFRPTPTASRYFEFVAESLGLPPHTRRLNEQNLRRVLQVVPSDLGQYLRAITHDTAVPTGLRAGTKINVVPSHAEALVDGRYLPGQTADGFLAEVRNLLGEGYEIEQLDNSPPLEDPPGGPLFETIASVMARHAPDAQVVPFMLAGATDAKHLARLGTKCLGFDPIRVPEGFPTEQLIHGHDERIPIDGYVWGLQVLYDVVTEFCGG